MKRVALITLMSAALSFVSATSKAGVLFSDNFESYPVNLWPSAGWTGFGGNDSNHAVNRIEIDPTDASNQVFRLSGVVGSFWGAGANSDVAFTERYRVDLRVYNGNESIPSQGHQSRAAVGMRGGGHYWGNGIGRGLFDFSKNGNVYAGGNILQTYETQRWYDVSVEYNRVSDSEVSLHYWIDDVDRGTFSFPVDDLARERAIDHIELVAQAGSVLYDDVRVTVVPAPPEVIGTDRELPGHEISRATSEHLQILSTDGKLKKDRPTLVLTHGFNLDRKSPSKYFESIVDSLHQSPAVDGWNIVAWEWIEDAAPIQGAVAIGWSRSRTLQQGDALATALRQDLVDGPRESDQGFVYDQPIHFIGHSLGTLVNAKAVDTLHAMTDSGFKAERTHVTLLDDAEIANLVPDITDPISGLLTVLPLPVILDAPYAPATPANAARIDNYISAVGLIRSDAHNVILTLANDMNARGFHNYPVDWYAASVNSPDSSPIGFGTSFELGAIMSTTTPSYYVQNRDGGELSLEKVDEEDAEEARAEERARLLPYQVINLVNRPVGAFRGAIESVGAVAAEMVTVMGSVDPLQDMEFMLRLILEENSPAYAWVPVAIPAEARMLSFDFMFDDMGDEDFLSFGIEDGLLFAMEGEYIDPNTFINSGLIDVSTFAGQEVDLVFGLNSDGVSGGRMTIEAIQFHVVPEPSTLALLAMGAVGLIVGWYRKRRAA